MYIINALSIIVQKKWDGVGKWVIENVFSRGTSKRGGSPSFFFFPLSFEGEGD